MLNKLTNLLAAAGLPVVGVSIGNPADRSTWKAHLDNGTPEQYAQAKAIIDGFDVAKEEHNAAIDAQIVGVEAANPITHRASREGLYAQALLADMLNETIAQIEAQIRTIQGHEAFTIQRLPDLKKNAGMVRIKTADDAIRVLRAQRLP